MSQIKPEVIAFPTKVRLMCSSCGSPGEGTCRCGAPYVTPGERAEEAVKANPGKSDRVIAEETGIPQRTVSRARNRTEPSGSVGKRVGKDGKARKQPKPKAPKPTPPVKEVDEKGRVAGVDIRVDPFVWQAFNEKARQEHKSATVKIAELIISEVDSSAPPRIELPKTAQEKVDAAQRKMERKLNAEHADRLKQIDEEVRQRVVSENKDYLEMLKAREKKARDTEATYQGFINNLKPIFTLAEYHTVLKCLDPKIEHQLKAPDPELVKRFNEATMIVRDKKERLTLKK